MKRLLLISLLGLAGCAEKKPAKPHVTPPPGYTQNGFCIGDGINVKTNTPDLLVCKTDDGKTVTYKRQ